MKTIKIPYTNAIAIGSFVLLFTVTVVAIAMIIKQRTKAINERRLRSQSHVPRYNDAVLGHAASSVDSERQFGVDSQWKGQPSKCYDCEEDMARRRGDAAVYNATKQKLFSV